MKLNFWQWLGVIALLIVVPIYIYRHYIAPKAPSTNSVVVGTPDTGNEAKTEADFFEAATTAPAQ
ncbi:MAG TPA: hypothetical protein PK402_08570 [Tepidisphaeraceae bacterium]|nr:hypothetical protein [Tepidisphaeraceae bacterium]